MARKARTLNTQKISQPMKASLGEIVKATNSVKYEARVSTLTRLLNQTNAWATKSLQIAKRLWQQKPARFVLAGIGAGLVFVTTAHNRKNA